ncbi:unnamed protein product [Caenorhabditis auriculariae]|uniref:Uncharacterized protein n=1 Tax=Caenorhabditis auriculariae TaxID=2777116 RepID=A0A8S1HQW6_9PELO|nr:unnamed protein product [Caenorhabditis auriculariae]
MFEEALVHLRTRLTRRCAMVAFVEIDSSDSTNDPSSDDLKLGQREKAGMGPVSVGGFCPTCQQGTLCSERDQTCFLIVILLSVLLFPYGLFSLMCIRKKLLKGEWKVVGSVYWKGGTRSVCVRGSWHQFDLTARLELEQELVLAHCTQELELELERELEQVQAHCTQSLGA